MFAKFDLNILRLEGKTIELRFGGPVISSGNLGESERAEIENAFRRIQSRVNQAGAPYLELKLSIE